MLTKRYGPLSAVVVIIAGLSAFAAVFGIRINTSYSLPLGLYQITADESAPLIEFCPDEPYASESSQRGYRTRGLICPDGAVPLLKPVVARVGDVVESSPKGLAINGTLLPNTAPLNKDAAGRALEPWPLGRYTVDPGTVWVASTYNYGSYDSRYIGPVEIRTIRRRLRPLWVLNFKG